MEHTTSRDSTTSRIATRLATGQFDERLWLGLALTAGLLVYGSYLLTHQYPAYGAGLYVQIADTISAHGYGLPPTVPGYTAEGVPLAYPPLMFYVVAAVRDLTGVDAFLLSRLLPGLVVLATVVPYFYVAQEFLGTPRRAAFASLVFAVAPPVLQWHLSAGGINRAPAFFFVVTGLFAGLRLFRHGDRRWLVPGLVLFALTILTHPLYAVCFGLNYLVLYAAFDRSPMGLVSGAVVAVGGVLVTAPWWLTVASHHGFDVFFGAAGTHSGLGGGTGRLYDEFVQPIVVADAVTPFFVVTYAAGLYALWKRRFLVPVWLFVSAWVLGKTRFQFLAGGILVAQFVFAVVPALVARFDAGTAPGWRRTASVLTVALLSLSAVGVGVAYAGGMVDSHHGDPSQPAFVDSHDVEAMQWAEANTAPSADFVVLGDAAEWFPQQTGRSILIGPWGVEWTTPARYEHQLNTFRDSSTCDDAACLTRFLESGSQSPEYVYVPKDEYTVRGMHHQQSPSMRDSLVESDRYTIVYENEGVVVVAVQEQTAAVGTGGADAEKRGSDYGSVGMTVDRARAQWQGL
ncbi:ArnT family glycosyltransferase [Haloarchaeobius sp. TZWSO28]|uniref:ArnT family glycosyltransferase n=1 Tax=Haloarchaeobius sp. TZWSO28 TaxID=3446119 RepID=UPI003EBB68D7